MNGEERKALDGMLRGRKGTNEVVRRIKALDMMKRRKEGDQWNGERKKGRKQ